MGGSVGKKKSKIIIVGLDNSGKSTMINKLKPKKVILSLFIENLNDSDVYSMRKMILQLQWVSKLKLSRKARLILQFSTCQGNRNIELCGSNTMRSPK